MKKTLTYYVVISVIIGSGIYLCEKSEIVLPKIIRFYVNDFLIIPIVLYISLFVIQRIKGNTKLKLSFRNILYVCAMYSVIFEYWLPKFHPRYTSDLVDVSFYFLGGFVFFYLQEKELKLVS
ncbi:hypothetical protein [Polaribacter gochangensis]|uniref:hypothetical protein n=1 Tax=Polaribacter gochangensis TaxID=3252903 RepID=UPI00390465B3